MKPIDVIRKIATSRTIQYVVLTGNKMPAMSAIAILTSLPDTEMTASFKVNRYRMGGTWEDITTLVVTF